MNLTTADVTKFIGGDLEFKNPGKEYIFRGRIKEATIEENVEENILTVELEWTARGLGYPTEPKSWIRANNRPYVASLKNTQVLINDDDILIINAPGAGELITLLAPCYSLDPSRVAGLELIDTD